MQVTLTAEQHRHVKQRAANGGISIAQFLRQLVDADAGDPPPAADVTAAFALGDSGGSHVARHKDDYVGQAVEGEWQRETARG